ncbi:MAG: MATE family efflux transporter [Paludibacteraceae bacterium]|nr:MATE family efflux transporter [Paludibacteraceae bacterium]MBR6493024.1 MATE family efflux transporter [Paludibacteraceae bacterium]
MRKAHNYDILRLAVPSILANITIPLVGIVDTAIVGHLSDAAAIGGIAIGTMLFDLLYWNFGFLRIGTSGLTAQAYGKGERLKVNGERVPDECRTILTQSLSVAMIAALFVWAIQWLFVTAVLAVVPCSSEVASVARQYFFVRIWAAPATLMLMALKGWFIGMQDTKSPMAVDILVNVVNMGASYYLAVHTPLGVVGVAWGTLIAQYCGLILATGILGFRYNVITICRYNEWKAALRWKELRRMMTLNGNLFIRSLCFMVVYVGFTSLASQYGDTELAVSSILMKLFMFFSYFVDGFAYAGEALVGKAFGERTMDKGQRTIDEVVRSLFNWSIGVGLIFTVIYTLWGKACIGLMTNEPEVLSTSTRYIGWLIAMPIISTLAFMWDGVYVGATAGVQIRNSMIWAAVGFVLAYVACFRFVGIQALYIAYFVHLIARVVYLTVKWKTING